MHLANSIHILNAFSHILHIVCSFRTDIAEFLICLATANIRKYRITDNFTSIFTCTCTISIYILHSVNSVYSQRKLALKETCTIIWIGKVSGAASVARESCRCRRTIHNYATRWIACKTSIILRCQFGLGQNRFEPYLFQLMGNRIHDMQQNVAAHSKLSAVTEEVK